MEKGSDDCWTYWTCWHVSDTVNFSLQKSLIEKERNISVVHQVKLLCINPFLIHVPNKVKEISIFIMPTNSFVFFLDGALLLFFIKLRHREMADDALPRPYLHGEGSPDRRVAAQRSGGFSWPTPPARTAVCQRSGRCWWLHHGAVGKQQIKLSSQATAKIKTNPRIQWKDLQSLWLLLWMSERNAGGLTELPAEPLPSWSSVFCSTAVSASRIFSTGISSFTPTLNSSSPSRSRFLWRSSCTAAFGNLTWTCIYRQENNWKQTDMPASMQEQFITIEENILLLRSETLH